MKKLIVVVIFLLIKEVSFSQNQYAYGTSLDSVEFNDIFTNDNGNTQTFFVYKPLSFNPLTSPLLIAIHGVGGNGTSEIVDLDSIAERRKALIVAPNYAFSGYSGIMRHQEPVAVYVDTIDLCIVIRPATFVLEKIYNHILQKEGIASMPTYMIGFSAGGQFVSRYMLIRQAYPDNIPIKMAVSSNAYFYTFPTDTFLSVPMTWTCGLIMPSIGLGYCNYAGNIYVWNCNNHIIQYYNENYAVLIGTADIGQLTGGSCSMAQGNNRYERALNFYNFADSNATSRGTTLRWLYQEIAGIGHDQYGMYNTKASPTDSFSIAETLLFDSPYVSVTNITPIASFYADTVQAEINVPISFINTSSNSSNYNWDFGDSTYSQLVSPTHIYQSVGIYTVGLTATDMNGCENWNEKRHYIKIVDPVSLTELNPLSNKIKIVPNPNHGLFTVHSSGSTNDLLLIINDILGNNIKQLAFTNTIVVNIEDNPAGIYFYHIFEAGKYLGSGKIFKI